MFVLIPHKTVVSYVIQTTYSARRSRQGALSIDLVKAKSMSTMTLPTRQFTIYKGASYDSYASRTT